MIILWTRVIPARGSLEAPAFFSLPPPAFVISQKKKVKTAPPGAKG